MSLVSSKDVSIEVAAAHVFHWLREADQIWMIAGKAVSRFGFGVVLLHRVVRLFVWVTGDTGGAWFQTFCMQSCHWHFAWGERKACKCSSNETVASTMVEYVANSSSFPHKIELITWLLQGCPWDLWFSFEEGENISASLADTLSPFKTGGLWWTRATTWC